MRPVLQVEPAASDRPKLPQLVGAVAWLPLAPDGQSRVTVIDGRVVLPDGVLGPAGRIDGVNLGLSTSDLTGAIALDGTFALNRQPFRVDARLGRPTPDSSSTLRLTLAADDDGISGGGQLTFGGVVWWGAQAPRLRGELVFEGGDARSAIGRLSEALGHHIVPMPSWLAAPFRWPARSRWETTACGFPTSRSIWTALRSAWPLQPGPGSQTRDRSLARCGADRAAGRGAARRPLWRLAPLVALVSSLRGRIDLSIGALDYRGDTVRRLRAALGRLRRRRRRGRGGASDLAGSDRRQLRRSARRWQRAGAAGQLYRGDREPARAAGLARPVARRCPRRTVESAQPGEPGVDRAGYLALRRHRASRRRLARDRAGRARSGATTRRRGELRGGPARPRCLLAGAGAHQSPAAARTTVPTGRRGDRSAIGSLELAGRPVPGSRPGRTRRGRATEDRAPRGRRPRRSDGRASRARSISRPALSTSRQSCAAFRRLGCCVASASSRRRC